MRLVLTRKRIVTVFLAMAFVLSLLTIQSPAYAAELGSRTSTVTYDKIPGSGHSWYYSAGSGNGTFVPAARVRQQGNASSWGIRWSKGKGVTIRAAISDIIADQRTPILVISYDYGDGSTFQRVELTTHAGEPSYSVPVSVTIPWKKGVTNWRRQSVMLTVCNGRDADGNPDQCGPNHGPFHAY
jgi:hypothetical protein